MRLFAGLGNPGARYAQNRHNAGFMAMDAIAARHSFPPARKRFAGFVSQARLGGVSVIALKPDTYMNESGRSLQQAMRYFSIKPEDVCVFYDEVDLPLGKMRFRRGGGLAGHNGLKSISAHIGPDFARVRIGVGHPGAAALVSRYVLSDFAKSERAIIASVCAAIADAAPLLVDGHETNFSNRVHLALNPDPKPAKGNADGI